MAKNPQVEVVGIDLAAITESIASAITLGEAARAAISPIQQLAGATKSVNVNFNTASLSKLTDFYKQLAKAVGASGEAAKESAEFMRQLNKTLETLQSASKTKGSLIGRSTLDDMRKVSQELAKWGKLIAQAQEGITKLSAGMNVSTEAAVMRAVQAQSGAQTAATTVVTSAAPVIPAPAVTTNRTRATRAPASSGGVHVITAEDAAYILQNNGKLPPNIQKAIDATRAASAHPVTPYYTPKTQGELARELGVSRSKISAATKATGVMPAVVPIGGGHLTRYQYTPNQANTIAHFIRTGEVKTSSGGMFEGIPQRSNPPQPVGVFRSQPTYPPNVYGMWGGIISQKTDPMSLNMNQLTTRALTGVPIPTVYRELLPPGASQVPTPSTEGPPPIHVPPPGRGPGMWGRIAPPTIVGPHSPLPYTPVYPVPQYRLPDSQRAAFHAETGTPRLASAFSTAANRIVAYGTLGMGMYGAIGEVRNIIDNITKAEQKLISLKKVLNPLTTDFNLMKDAMFDMAVETGRTFEESGDVMFEFAKQGRSATDVLKLSKQALIMSNIGEMMPQEAVKALTTILAQFNMQVEESSGVVDKLNNVSNKNAVSFKALAESLIQTGSAFKTQGGSFEDMLGLVTGLSQSTQLTGPTMGRVFRQFFGRMARPAFAGLARKEGIETHDQFGRRLDPFAVLNQVAEKWKDFSPDKMMEFSQAAGGTRFYSHFSALMGMWPVVEKARNDALQGELSAYKENLIYMKSYEAQANQAKAAWAQWSQTVGEGGLLEFLKNFANLSEDIAKSGAMRSIGHAAGSPEGIYGGAGLLGLLAASQGLKALNAPALYGMKSLAIGPEAATEISKMGASAQLTNMLAMYNQRRGLRAVIDNQLAQGVPMADVRSGYQPTQVGGPLALGGQIVKVVKGAGVWGAVILAVIAAIATTAIVIKKKLNNIEKEWEQAEESSKIFRFAAVDVSMAMEQLSKSKGSGIADAQLNVTKSYLTLSKSVQDMAKLTRTLWRGHSSNYYNNVMGALGLRLGDAGPEVLWQGEYLNMDQFKNLSKEEQDKATKELRNRASRVELYNREFAAWATYTGRVATMDKDPYFNPLRREGGDLGPIRSRSPKTTERAKQILQDRLAKMEENNAISLISLDNERKEIEEYFNARFNEVKNNRRLTPDQRNAQMAELQISRSEALNAIDIRESSYKEDSIKIAEAAREAGVEVQEIINRLSILSRDANGNPSSYDEDFRKELEARLKEAQSYQAAVDIYLADTEELSKMVKDITQEYENQLSILKAQSALVAHNTSMFGLKDTSFAKELGLDNADKGVEALEKRIDGERKIRKQLEDTVRSLVGEKGTLENPIEGSALYEANRRLGTAQAAVLKFQGDESEEGKRKHAQAENDLKQAQADVDTYREQYETFSKDLNESQQRYNGLVAQLYEQRQAELGIVGELLQQYLGIVGAAENLAEVMNGIYKDMHRFATQVISSEVSMAKLSTQRGIYAGFAPTSDFGDKADELYLQQMKERNSFMEGQYSYYLEMGKKSELAQRELLAQRTVAEPWVESETRRTALQSMKLFAFDGQSNFADLFFGGKNSNETLQNMMGHLLGLGGLAVSAGQAPMGWSEGMLRGNIYQPVDPRKGPIQNSKEVWERYIRMYNLSSQAGLPIVSGGDPSKQIVDPKTLNKAVSEYSEKIKRQAGETDKAFKDRRGKLIFDYLGATVGQQFEMMIPGLKKSGIFERIETMMNDLAQTPALVFSRQWQKAWEEVGKASEYYVGNAVKWQAEYIKATFQTMLAEVVVASRAATNEIQRGMEKSYVTQFISRYQGGLSYGMKYIAGTRPGMGGYESLAGSALKSIGEGISSKESTYRDLMYQMYQERKKASEIMGASRATGIDMSGDLRPLIEDMNRKAITGRELLRQINRDIQDQIVLGYAVDLETAINGIVKIVKDISATSGMNVISSIVAGARGGLLGDTPGAATGIHSAVSGSLSKSIEAYMSVSQKAAEIQERINNLTSSNIDMRDRLTQQLKEYNGEMTKLQSTISDIAMAELFTSRQKQLFDALNQYNELGAALKLTEATRTTLDPYITGAQQAAGLTRLSYGFTTPAQRRLEESQGAVQSITKLMSDIASGMVGLDDAISIASKILPGGVYTAPGETQQIALQRALTDALIKANEATLDTRIEAQQGSILGGFASIMAEGGAGGFAGAGKTARLFQKASIDIAEDIFKYGGADIKRALVQMIGGAGLSQAITGLSKEDAARLTQYDDWKKKGRLAADMERFTEASINAPSFINGRLLSPVEIMRMSGASMNIEGSTPEDRLTEAINSLYPDMIEALTGNSAALKTYGSPLLSAIPLGDAIVPNIQKPGIYTPNIPGLEAPNLLSKPSGLPTPGIPDYRDSLDNLAKTIQAHFPSLVRAIEQLSPVGAGAGDPKRNILSALEHPTETSPEQLHFKPMIRFSPAVLKRAGVE